jgi:hypothetical protein
MWVNHADTYMEHHGVDISFIAKAAETGMFNQQMDVY